MKRLFRLPLALTLCLLTTVTLAARDPLDNEGTFEHPEVVRFPGFHIDNSKRTDYDEVRFATQGFDGSNEPIGQVKAGRYWFVDYCLNEGARQPSAIELFRNYENAFRKAGGSLVKRHPDYGPPESAVYRMPRAGGGERWVQLDVAGEGVRYQLKIVDVAGMAQKVEFSASQMADALRKEGFIALTGIQFDTGKATIKPESANLLDEVVALLKGDKALKLSVEGHTDNVGDKRANLLLSKQRAESVVKYLAGRGIDIRRLKFDGKGDTVPVADNRSESGRARNRRVELVRL